MKSIVACAGAMSAALACSAFAPEPQTATAAPVQATDAAAQTPAPTPAPAYAGPPIALSPSVTTAAAAYAAYVRQATALKPGFVDGESIQTSLRQGEAYEPNTLARDTVAFAAIVALQEPSFVQGVRALAGNDHERDTMIRRIEENPDYAATLPGAEAAANLVAIRLSADGEAIAKAGWDIKQSAYTIQRQKWSTEFVKDRDGRLGMAKHLSETAAVGTPEDAAALMQAAVTGQGLPKPVAAPPPAPVAVATPAPVKSVHKGKTSRHGKSTVHKVTVPAAPAPEPAAVAAAAQAPALKPPYTAGVNRSLAIAALAILGAGGADNADHVDPLMEENVGAPCLKLAKLNLFQCLAVAKPHYEDVFCLGQHALMDTGECVSRTAGAVPVDFVAALRAELAAKKIKGGSHATHRRKKSA